MRALALALALLLGSLSQTHAAASLSSWAFPISSDHRHASIGAQAAAVDALESPPLQCGNKAFVPANRTASSVAAGTSLSPQEAKRQYVAPRAQHLLATPCVEAAVAAQGAGGAAVPRAVPFPQVGAAQGPVPAEPFPEVLAPLPSVPVVGGGVAPPPAGGGRKGGSFHPSLIDRAKRAGSGAKKPPAPKPLTKPPSTGRAVPPPGLTPTSDIFPICNQKGALNIRLPTTTMGFTWKGWGTSIAWMGNFVGRFTADRFNYLLDLLFTKRGLGLTMARFNIAGGLNPRYSPQMLTDDMFRWRAMPGYKAGPRAGYDWRNDWAQRRFLYGAVKRGVGFVEAVSFSPPWWMTNSFDVAGGVGGKANLDPKYTQQFATYLADVVEHFAKKWNITFNTIAPFNEPMEGFWKSGGMQEGCSLSPAGMESVAEWLERILRQRKLKMRLAAMDDWIETTVSNWTSSLMSHYAMSRVLRVNVHGYLRQAPKGMSPRLHAYDAYWQMREAAQAAKKEVYVSEWGPMGPDGGDLDIALFMARRIIEATNILGATAWFYWQPIDCVPFWSLINIDWNHSLPSDPFSVSLSKKYYVMRHFTTFVKPGAQQLSVSNWSCAHCMAAFYHPQQLSLSLHVVNQQARDVPVSYDFSRWMATTFAPPISAVRTSYFENMAKVKVRAAGQGLTFTAKGQSLTTIVVSGLKPP